MEVILNNLGQTIKLARISADLTQGELTENIGVTGRYIMALENEKEQLPMEAFPLR